jgi:predicted metalloprotease
MQRGLSEAASNKVQVKVELGADCFAGIWAHHAQAKWDFLEPGDVEAVLATIAATGDDALQRQEEGEVMPDTFTHGTSEQRRRWFLRGFTSGAMADCNGLDVAEP